MEGWPHTSNANHGCVLAMWKNVVSFPAGVPGTSISVVSMCIQSLRLLLKPPDTDIKLLFLSKLLNLTPSTTSTVGNRTFYYISQTVRRRFQFQDLSVVDQTVLVVYFNKGFKVERIANYGLQDGVIFDFISRTTATGGEEQSFLRNLFRGVTRFNPLGA